MVCDFLCCPDTVHNIVWAAGSCQQLQGEPLDRHYVNIHTWRSKTHSCQSHRQPPHSEETMDRDTDISALLGWNDKYSVCIITLFFFLPCVVELLFLCIRHVFGGWRVMMMMMNGRAGQEVVGLLWQHRWNKANAMMCVSSWVSAKVTCWFVPCVISCISLLPNEAVISRVVCVVCCVCTCVCTCLHAKKLNYRDVFFFWPCHSSAVSHPTKVLCTVAGNILYSNSSWFVSWLHHMSVAAARFKVSAGNLLPSPPLSYAYSV